MRSDPYRYFRIEARELTDRLGQGVLALEKGPPGDVVAQLLRAAHTLKGAARVVKQGRIAENAHAIEDILAPIRNAEQAVGREQVERLLGLVDEISGLVAVLETPAVVKQAARANVPEELHSGTGRDHGLGVARVDTTEMDALLDGVLETAIRLRTVRGTLGALAEIRRLTDVLVGQAGAAANRDGTRPGGSAVSKTRELGIELRGLVTAMDRSLSAGLDQADRELEQVRDTAERLRLVPAGALFPSLERTIRDVAHALGKEVSFQGDGGDVRIDAHVVAELQGALIQIMRNAVAHGIETPTERASARKPRMGAVELSIERRGTRVACVCRDDGRGIDATRVRAAAEKSGLIRKEIEEAPLTEEALLSLLMKGGFSTSGAVTEMSGRGIGLDIVRETALRLGGTITLRTEPGRGTTLELLVPVSLSALDALLVEAAGDTAAIPLESVQRTLRLGPGDVVRAAEGESIVHEGRVVPFARLARSAKAGGEARAAGFTSAVVIQAKGAVAAISVDRLIGTANIVVRPLPALSLADPMVAGVSLDGEGMPRLVLDPEGLVALALVRRGAAPEPEASRPARILIIDDSLTTRMLEQSILESAGYEVSLASSAEEGLEKAAGERYALFLVDVEMPGMDGFTFVERTRADPVFRETPAILVSSRNAPEDLERGRQAGAYAYVVKGDFDQAGLLSIIRGLVSP